MKQDKALAMIGLAQKAGKAENLQQKRQSRPGKPHWLLLQEMHRKIQRRCLQICVHFMRCLFTFTVTKKHLVMQSANSFGHHSQSQMKALEIQSKSI